MLAKQGAAGQHAINANAGEIQVNLVSLQKRKDKLLKIFNYWSTLLHDAKFFCNTAHKNNFDFFSSAVPSSLIARLTCLGQNRSSNAMIDLRAEESKEHVATGKPHVSKINFNVFHCRRKNDKNIVAMSRLLRKAASLTFTKIAVDVNILVICIIVQISYSVEAHYENLTVRKHYLQQHHQERKPLGCSFQQLKEVIEKYDTRMLNGHVLLCRQAPPAGAVNVFDLSKVEKQSSSIKAT